ncbi:1-phosphofructokinase family hexose kinase [Actibacterium lipolyticum]|uniref:Phosphofructokinase n=1 Tax=Actibacterium lipolyticum TaxID=1524263 RepID=A0A238JLG3_9RHOB|nr:1-phosphofructokinase family hexose kinase [Actibacterium lipolyticum]SMX31509.1 6-phosphofructokinase isozyme 2 [Actibacterium lipolyticum]
MHDILTVTLNPAVDLSTSVDHVEAGPKLRCDRPMTDPGGGGINVSRAIGILGGQSRAMVAVGGATGDMLLGLLANEGISTLPFDSPGATRQSLAVTDRGTGQQYRFVMPGPDWDQAQLNSVLKAIADAVPQGGYVVLSGSQPPGIPPEFASLVCTALSATGARVIVDTSGDALHHLAEAKTAPPFILRMDGEEAEGLAKRPLPTREDSAEFAASLVAKGAAEAVIVARGADGSVLATKDERLHAMAADVPVKSKVGAGDSFVGGFTLALAQGCDYGTALQRGAASASAAVMTDATRLCTREDAERLVAECPLTRL